MHNMHELEGNDIRLVAFFMYALWEKLKPLFENKIRFACSLEISLREEMVDCIAIFEKGPNTNFGQPPCYINEPLVVLQKTPLCGRFMLSATSKVWDNPEAKNAVMQLKDDFEKNEGVCFSTFRLYNMPVIDGRRKS